MTTTAQLRLKQLKRCMPARVAVFPFYEVFHQLNCTCGDSGSLCGYCCCSDRIKACLLEMI